LERSALERLDRIVTYVEQQGYVSVKELSNLCDVSEMTIRRDLQRLEEAKRIQRTYGGALPFNQRNSGHNSELDARSEGLLVDRVDVLINSSINPKYDKILLERIRKKGIPTIAESIQMADQTPLVAVDNYKAGYSLGFWAGTYISEKWKVKPQVLDLTYHFHNTQNRSRGFISGILEAEPSSEIILSINGQSDFDTAYQLTQDALTVHREINVIFSINDTMAAGAIKACQDMNIEPENILVLPFGLEGDSLKNMLHEGKYCKAGLAMFPEIVAPTCIDAAILKFNHHVLPSHYITPHAVLTTRTLEDYYQLTSHGWVIQWETIRNVFHYTFPLENKGMPLSLCYPNTIGFIVPFKKHEWYRTLIAEMQKRATFYHIKFEVLDAKKEMQDEMDFRRREIARLAAEQIKPSDVIIIDEGLMSKYLAEALLNKQDISVITNSLVAFEILKQNLAIVLILLGGIYRRSTQVLVGPTAENALRDLRADKLFIMVSGVALSFGLSHTNVSEVSIKQAMLRSAREIILLADHTFFEQESVIQIAPLSVIHQLVTDDAIPASLRLEIAKMGIQITLASV